MVFDLPLKARENANFCVSATKGALGAKFGIPRFGSGMNS
jgi:hypothetical protein